MINLRAKKRSVTDTVLLILVLMAVVKTAAFLIRAAWQ